MHHVRTIVTHAFVAGIAVASTYFLVAPGAPASGGAQATGSTQSAPGTTSGGAVGGAAASQAAGFEKEIQAMAKLSSVECHRRMIDLVGRVDAASFPAVWRALKAYPNAATQFGMSALLDKFGTAQPELCRNTIGEQQWKEARFEVRIRALGDDTEAFKSLLKELKTEKIGHLNALHEYARSHPMVAWEIYKNQDIAGADDGYHHCGIDECLDSLAESDPTRALSMVMELSKKRRSHRLTSILSSLYDKDPAAALAWVDANPGEGRNLRREMIEGSNAYRDLLERDPAAALERFGKEGTGLRDSCLRRWKDKDGAGFCSWIQEQYAKDPDAAQESLKAAMRSSYLEDDESARHLQPLIAMLPDGSARRELAKQIVGSMAKTDPEAALAWANSLPVGTSRKDSIEAVVETAFQSGDPAKVLGLIDKHPEVMDESESYYMNFSALMGNDMPGTLALYGRLPKTLQERYSSSFMGELFEQDPQEARRFVDAQTGDAAIALRGQYAQKLALQDPFAALEYVKGFPDDKRKAAIRSVVLSALGDRRGDYDDERVSVDRQALLAAIPDDKLRDDVRKQWIMRMADEDPAKAMRLLQDGSSAASPEDIARVANSWAQYNPVEAANWASTLPEGKVREEVVSAMIGPIFDVDPASGIDWINSLPKETSERYLRQLVLAVANPDNDNFSDAKRKIVEQKLTSLGYQVQKMSRRDYRKAVEAEYKAEMARRLAEAKDSGEANEGEDDEMMMDEE